MARPVVAIALTWLALAAGPAWSATAWSSDPATGKLKFVATQAGGEFEASFKRFTPAVSFASDDLAHSRFTVEIDLSSTDTGEADRDNTLKGKDFFAVSQWPAAHFETQSFRATGTGAYEATGKLTLRNVTHEVRLPFTFKPAPDGLTAVLAGGTTIRRLDYGVGQGEWSDTEWVGNDVRIRFELHLKRATP